RWARPGRWAARPAARARDLAHAPARAARAGSPERPDRRLANATDRARARAAVVANAPRRGTGGARQPVGRVRTDPAPGSHLPGRGRLRRVQAGSDSALRNRLGRPAPRVLCGARATRRNRGTGVSLLRLFTRHAVGLRLLRQPQHTRAGDGYAATRRDGQEAVAIGARAAPRQRRGAWARLVLQRLGDVQRAAS